VSEKERQKSSLRAIVRFDGEKFRELERCTGAESENDLINGAFSLLHWVTDRLYEGYDDVAVICSDGHRVDVRKINFAFIDRIKQLAKEKRKTSRPQKAKRKRKSS